MRVIDAHAHLDERVPGDAQHAVAAFLAQMDRAGIRRAVVLHLRSQRWPLEDVAAAVRPHSDRLAPFVNVHPASPAAMSDLRAARDTLGMVGLKLHPRLERYGLDDPRTHALVREAGALGMPVLIDAFPDGEHILQGFDPAAYGRLARAAPMTKVIAAHMGGHRVLDMMMVAKRTPNLYLDTSYALLYYRGSSVTQDMTYAMRSMRFERVMYGSDHPDRPMDTTLDGSVEVLRAAGFDDAALDKILYQNAVELFGWKDL